MTLHATEVQEYLKDAEYPTNGQQLADLARRNGGPAELVEVLHKIDRADEPNGLMQLITDRLGRTIN